MAKNRRVSTLALALWTLCIGSWLLLATLTVVAGPTYTVWGYVTYDSAQGHPVPETAVRCNVVIDGVQHGTPPGYPGTDGYYQIEFDTGAEQLRIYLETPEDMIVIGNSSCAPCGPWNVNLIVCNSPSGNIGPINFFVHYLVPPTPTPTSTPTVTQTAIQTSTPAVTLTATQTSPPAATPTETPYLMPTVSPEGRPTPDSFLGIAQRELENQIEFLAIFRYFVYGVLGALATMVVYTTTQSKRS